MLHRDHQESYRPDCYQCQRDEYQRQQDRDREERRKEAAALRKEMFQNSPRSGPSIFRYDAWPHTLPEIGMSFVALVAMYFFARWTGYLPSPASADFPWKAVGWTLVGFFVLIFLCILPRGSFSKIVLVLVLALGFLFYHYALSPNQFKLRSHAPPNRHQPHGSAPNTDRSQGHFLCRPLKMHLWHVATVRQGSQCCCPVRPRMQLCNRTILCL
jgi:hypothetical protein